MILAELVFGCLLISGIFRGYKAGFVQGVADLFACIIGFIAARWAYPFVGKLLMVFLPGGTSSFGQFLAYLVLYILCWKIVSALLGIGVSVLKIVTSLPLISHLNKFFGAFLGIVSMVVFIGATTYLVMQTKLDPKVMEWFGGSTIALYCQKTFMKLLFFLT